MNTTWKTIRIFISSTFRDMHTERDHLVRFVFPELKEKCRKKHVHLIDVDLRWGVTEADVQDGKALDICMDEIDTCRPYFLGLLGHCYGSIPPGETYSITAQEIFHGVLHNDIPTQVVDLRRIIEGKLEGKMLTNKQINCLVRCYRWNTDKSKYLLSVDATDDELEIIRSVFKKYSVYQRDRSFFFFRSESLTRKLAGKKIDELTDRERVNQHKLDELKEKIKDGFIEKEKVNQDKLADLKQDIIDAKLPYFKYDDIEAFGEKVKEVLWERIEAELGEPLEEEKDWLEEEAEFHDLFIEDRTRRFVGRRKLLDRMNDFCGQNCEPSVMVITGEPGCGKSALMGRFSEEIILNHPDWLIIPHFVGSSPDSTSLRQTLKRLCTYLHKQLDEKDEVPEDIKELKQIFPDWLAKAAEQRRILIILDAVNQLEKTDNAHAMQWLPLKLPENVRYMISTLEGEAHDALMVRRDKPEEVRVAGLDKQEIKKLVHDYLKEIRKDFPNKDAEKTFYEKIKLGNPLYILVALEELRVFGDFYGLPKKIKRLPGNVPELFGQILERIEYDFSKPLVKDCMALIACGRQGMTAEELQALLAAYAPQHDDMIPAYRLPDMTWARLYRTFRSYLFERSGVIDFFHGQLKEAVEKRYLREEVDQNATHKIIADYFEKRWREPYNRALEELPHQLTKAADWSGIERVLCDLQFIEAKCAARMTYKLIVDYNTALSSLPDAQQEIQIERRYQARLNKYVDEMAYYAEAWNEAWSSHVLNPKINPMPQIGKIKVPDIVSSIKPWTEEEIAKKQEKVICNPTRLNRIRAFSKFVNKEYHYLKEVVLPPGFAIQLAYNSARNGPVFDLAKNLIDHNQKDLFLLKPSSQKPTFLQDSALLRVIDTGNDAVDTIDLSADGKIAVTKNGTDSSLVWDIQSGRLISNLEGIPTYNIALSLNSKTAISLSKKRLQVWDVQNGKILKILKVGSIYRKSLKVTSDGRLLLEKVPELNSFSFRSLFSTRYARIVGGWLEVLFRKAKKEKLEFGHFVTANNKVMVAAGRRNSVIVLDMNIGLIINSYKKTKFFISEAVVSLDNRIAVTAGHNIYSHKVDWLGIWDLTTGKCLHSPWTVKEISSLALTFNAHHN
jgi:WD40 repeat protein